MDKPCCGHLIVVADVCAVPVPAICPMPPDKGSRCPYNTHLQAKPLHPLTELPAALLPVTRCVGFLQHLTYITPNVHELLAIAQQLQPALAGQQPPSSRSSSRSRHRQPPPPLTAEQLQALPAAQQLAKLAPQLALVLRAGTPSCRLALLRHGHRIALTCLLLAGPQQCEA